MYVSGDPVVQTPYPQPVTYGLACSIWCRTVTCGVSNASKSDQYNMSMVLGSFASIVFRLCYHNLSTLSPLQTLFVATSLSSATSHLLGTLSGPNIHTHFALPLDTACTCCIRCCLLSALRDCILHPAPICSPLYIVYHSLHCQCIGLHCNLSALCLLSALEILHSRVSWLCSSLCSIRCALSLLCRTLLEICSQPFSGSPVSLLLGSLKILFFTVLNFYGCYW